jgi:hypothetical protein
VWPRQRTTSVLTHTYCYSSREYRHWQRVIVSGAVMLERCRIWARPALERNGWPHRLEVQEVTRIRPSLKELSESGLHMRCEHTEGNAAARRPAQKKNPAKTSGGWARDAWARWCDRALTPAAQGRGRSTSSIENPTPKRLARHVNSKPNCTVPLP